MDCDGETTGSGGCAAVLVSELRHRARDLEVGVLFPVFRASFAPPELEMRCKVGVNGRDPGGVGDTPTVPLPTLPCRSPALKGKEIREGLVEDAFGPESGFPMRACMAYNA